MSRGEPTAKERLHFKSAAIPSVVLSDVFNPEETQTLRAHVRSLNFEHVEVAGRARYTATHVPLNQAPVPALQQLTENLLGQALVFESGRWLRLQHRDYALAPDDRLTSPIHRAFIEVIVDISERSSNEGQITYSDGERVFVAPQRSGSVSIVQRCPGLQRTQRYLTVRSEHDTIIRLIALFRERA